MSLSGGILFFITCLTFLVLLGVSLFFYWKKINWKWWYTSIIAAVFFIYFLVGRYVQEVRDCVQMNFLHINVKGSFVASITISKAFLLDMCPCMLFILCLVSLTKPTQKYAKVLAPIALWISFMTISLGICTKQFTLTWQYFFLGFYPNLMFFMLHYLMFILAIILVLTTKKYEWSNYVVALGSVLVYISYVFLIHYLTNASWNLTGLVKNDWIVHQSVIYHFTTMGVWKTTIYQPGEYYDLGKYFHLLWPSGPVFLFLVSAIFVTLTALVNHYIHYFLFVFYVFKKHLIKQIVIVNADKLSKKKKTVEL